jgi:hypothetical protein
MINGELCGFLVVFKAEFFCYESKLDVGFVSRRSQQWQMEYGTWTYDLLIAASAASLSRSTNMSIR